MKETRNLICIPFMLKTCSLFLSASAKILQRILKLLHTERGKSHKWVIDNLMKKENKIAMRLRAQQRFLL